MNEMEKLQKRSGTVKSKDKLVTFLYILMRDHLPLGEVEGIMMNHINDKESTFTNGWLANYAKDIARRFQNGNQN